MKQALQNTSKYQISAKSTKGFGSYEHLKFRYMCPLKYRLWCHNYLIIVMSQTFSLLLCRIHQAWYLCQIWWPSKQQQQSYDGGLHDWRFKRSPCQIELSLFWWTDISTCICSLFVAFLLLCHIWIHPRKIRGILTYSNDERPWVIAILFSTE